MPEGLRRATPKEWNEMVMESEEKLKIMNNIRSVKCELDRMEHKINKVRDTVEQTRLLFKEIK